jgi:hypothetical protein
MVGGGSIRFTGSSNAPVQAFRTDIIAFRPFLSRCRVAGYADLLEQKNPSAQGRLRAFFEICSTRRRE